MNDFESKLFVESLDISLIVYEVFQVFGSRSDRL